MHERTNRKKAADQLVAMAAVGDAAMAYMAAEAREKSTRDDYREARDAFLRMANPERTLRTSAFIGSEEFQAATGDLYARYLKARREARNAKRRLATQCRNANAGGAK